MTFDLRAWGERHKTKEAMPWQLLEIGRTSFYKYCAAGSLPKWLVLACERLDDEWMPIESAPRDGTRVDLWVIFDNGEAGRAEDAEYENGVWWAELCGSLLCEPEFKPTHWKPLPRPPATSAPQSQEK